MTPFALFRGRISSIVALEHLYHREHHLYPQAVLLTHDDRGFLETLVGDGRPLLILSAVLLVGCGAFAVFQAATGHFLPHDTVYLGMTAPEICAVQDCRVLYFMIHDRV